MLKLRNWELPSNTHRPTFCVPQLRNKYQESLVPMISSMILDRFFAQMAQPFSPVGDVGDDGEFDVRYCFESENEIALPSVLYNVADSPL